MKPEDYPEPYRDMYAAHLTFKSLGFSSDDLFVDLGPHVKPAGGPVIPNVFAMFLRAQGKEFVVAVAPMGKDVVRTEVFEKWAAFVEVIQDPELPEERLTEIWRQSRFGGVDTIVHVADMLLSRGFTIRAPQ